MNTESNTRTRAAGDQRRQSREQVDAERGPRKKQALSCSSRGKPTSVVCILSFDGVKEVEGAAPRANCEPCPGDNQRNENTAMARGPSVTALQLVPELLWYVEICGSAGV